MKLTGHFKILYFVITVLLLSSCKKDKEEEPLIDPFLEVTGFEEVEPANFKVFAQIKEKGSLPILEYGFMFSDEPTLYYSSDRIDQIDGNPGEKFETSFERILEKGKNYYLQAFVRTQKDITYSPVFRFEAGDPPSFQYFDSSFPEQVYYGDTVTITGKFLPKSLDDINAKFHLINAELFNLTDTSFSYTIPIDIFFGGEYRTKGFVLKLRIKGQHSEIYQKLKFRPAEFPEYTEVSMAEIWELPGNYLFSTNYHINGLEGTELYGSYSVHYLEDNRITFSPNFVPNTNEPTLGIYLRDSTYTARHIKIRTAEFLPGQQRTVTKSNQSITVNSRDFNAFVKTGNQLIIDTPGQVIANVIKADSENISFTLHLTAPLQGRTFNLYGYNQNVKGEVPLKITYQAPAYPISYLDISSDENFVASAVAFSQNNKIHVITDIGSFIYNVSEKRTTTRGALPNGFSEASVFKVFFNGKYYFSNVPTTEGAVNAVPLFAYDPTSAQSSSPGYLPKSGRILSSFVLGEKMYYEVGYIHGYEYIEELWTWNGKYNSEWELIRSNNLPEPDFYDAGKVFEWEGRILRFIQQYDSSKEVIVDKLERFNPQTFTWELMQSFPEKFDNTYRAFSTEAGVYLTNGNEFYLFNPTNLSIKSLGRTNDYNFIPESLVYVDTKFYYVNRDGTALIYELDLDLLEP